LPRNLYITARIHFIMSPGFLYLGKANFSSMCAGEAIYSGINCAFEIFRKTVLQTVFIDCSGSKTIFKIVLRKCNL